MRPKKITLPYAVCLFVLVSLVLVLAATTTGGMAYLEREKHRPELARHALAEALSRSNAALASDVESTLDHVKLGGLWLSRGVLPADSPDQWASLLLAPLTERLEIRSLAIASEHGLLWYAARIDRGWKGGWGAPDNPDTVNATPQWDRLGNLVAVGAPAMPGEATPFFRSMDNWFSRGGDESAIHVDVIDMGNGQSGMLLAVAVRGATDGEKLLVAGVIDCTAMKGPLGDNPDIFIHQDPGGELLSQLDTSGTLALLTTNAVPDRANLALRTLFAMPDQEEHDRWYAAMPYEVTPEYTWWNLASIPDSRLASGKLPLERYAGLGLLVGLAGASLVALVMTRKISAPLTHIARRAQGIQAIDEHYLPWPESRFTEVNALTNALEDLYETAVEHLDYHEAPLVVWAQPEAASEDDGILDAEPLKRHVNLRPVEKEPAPVEGNNGGAVINIRGESPPPAVPAAQLQILHGSRRELRRTQGQLAGVRAELRTAEAHFKQGEARLRRQRTGLRKLDKDLHTHNGISAAALTIIRDTLGADRVSLWRLRADGEPSFALRASTEHSPDATPIAAGLTLRAALQEEYVVASRDFREDPRLAELLNCPQWADRSCALLLAPLRFQGKLLGFILIEQDRTDVVWKVDEEAFASNCAIQCTMILGYKRNKVEDTQPAPPNEKRPEDRLELPDAAGLIEWETDRAGCITSVQGDVFGVYGYDPELLIGRPITFLTSREQGAADMAQLRHTLSGESCGGYQTRHQASDGHVVELTVRGEIQRDAAGRVAGVRGTASMSCIPTV